VLITNEILELSLFIFDYAGAAPKGGFTKSTLQTIKSLGEHALVELFASHSVARPEVLGMAFSMISEDPNISVKSDYCNIVEKIASKHLMILCDCIFITM
jgi:hypothetical protein